MQDSRISGNSRYIWGICLQDQQQTPGKSTYHVFHSIVTKIIVTEIPEIPEKTFSKNLKNQTNLTNIEVQFSTLTHRNFRPVIRDFFWKKFLSKWLSNKILTKQAETFDIKANSILQIFKKPAQKFIQNMPENHIFGTKKLTRKLIQKAELD